MKTVNIVGLLIIIGLLTYLAFFKKPKVVEVPVPNYITDTIIVSEPYIVNKPYPVEVPPKTVYQYYPVFDSLRLDSLLWKISENEMVIEYLNNSLTYNERFLITYPLNPKLIDFDLKRDSLSLSLLNGNGDFYSYTYPLNLMAYKYRWNQTDKLTRKNDPYIIPKDNPFSLYGNVGYDFIHVTPYLGFTFDKPLGKFKVYAVTDIGLLDFNSSSIKIGVGYKLPLK